MFIGVNFPLSTAFAVSYRFLLLLYFQFYLIQIFFYFFFLIIFIDAKPI